MTGFNDGWDDNELDMLFSEFEERCMESSIENQACYRGSEQQILDSKMRKDAETKKLNHFRSKLKGDFK